MPGKQSNRGSKGYDAIDPADPLVVRYHDQTIGWGRSLAEIDRRIAEGERRRELSEQATKTW